ncbi:hypothetical protein, partial [Chamaesiphon sp.]|uniref:hypothetical protein n=1 Tax=Chamaesiphon sp. TaxID=2814140 RepID=UPI003593FC5D
MKKPLDLSSYKEQQLLDRVIVALFGDLLSTVCLSFLAAWCNTCTRVPPPEQHPQTLGRAYVSRAAGATPAPGILRLNSIRN